MLAVEPTTLFDALRRLKLWHKDVGFTGSVALLNDPEPREAVKEVRKA